MNFPEEFEVENRMPAEARHVLGLKRRETLEIIE